LLLAIFSLIANVFLPTFDLVRQPHKPMSTGTLEKVAPVRTLFV